jgi:riboflavin kinase/FMN adenylyltransferase
MSTMKGNQAVWLEEGDSPPEALRGGAVAVGNFDGVHRGHAELIRILRECGRPAVVISFDPHPLQLLNPKHFQPELTTPGDRANDLRQCGADGVCFLRTTPQLLCLSAAEFFYRILHKGFAARAVVEGFNFRFGRDRAGDVYQLRDWCERSNIRFQLVEPVVWEGKPVSSSRVRQAIEAGEVEEAHHLLGRCYRLRGVVGRGAQRGRLLGFPTANLERVPTLIPGDGVYAVRVEGANGHQWGAAHIGPAPTFREQARRLEIHILDFAGDLYGQELVVHFVQLIRPIRPFAHAEDLVAQLQRDVEHVRRIAREMTA